METTQDDTTMRATQEATKESERTIVVFKEEDEMKRVEFLRDNKPVYNNGHMDYKDPNKRWALWDKFCTENKMDKATCKRQFHS